MLKLNKALKYVNASQELVNSGYIPSKKDVELLLKLQHQLKPLRDGMIRKFRDAGYTSVDISEIFELTQARISQILKETETTKSKGNLS